MDSQHFTRNLVKLHRQICGKNTFNAALEALPGDHMGVMQHRTSMVPAMD